MLSVAFPPLVWLQGHVAEEVRHRLAVVSPADGLSEDHGDVNDLNFGTMFHLLLLRNCIGDDHSLKAGIVDARDSRAREDAVR